MLAGEFCKVTDTEKHWPIELGIQGYVFLLTVNHICVEFCVPGDSAHKYSMLSPDIAAEKIFIFSLQNREKMNTIRDL